MSFLSDYTEKNSNLIPQIDIPCFAWNSQAEQGLLFFKAKSLAALELAVLGILWHAGQIPYAYAVYTGIFITALFMLVGKAQLWIQSHTENG